MSALSPEGQRMVQALRSEAMSPDERARLRARVLGSAAAAATLVAASTAASAQAGASAAAGAVGATQTAAATVTATAVAAPVSFGAKVAGVSLAWKLGVASALVAAVPVTHSLVQTREEASRVEQHEPARRTIARERAPRRFVAPDPAVFVPRIEPPPVEAPQLAAVVEAASVQPVVAAPAVKPRAEPPVSEPVAASQSGRPGLSASTLRAESALLEQALEAERDGQLELARQALERHARTYPNGLLAPERERVRARLND
jgi:TolA-binding protein